MTLKQKCTQFQMNMYKHEQMLTELFYGKHMENVKNIGFEVIIS